jgi:hypothetical protein
MRGVARILIAEPVDGELSSLQLALTLLGHETLVGRETRLERLEEVDLVLLGPGYPKPYARPPRDGEAPVLVVGGPSLVRAFTLAELEQALGHALRVD